MKQIIMLALMISLASCKNQIICSQVNSAKIKPLIIKDLSLQFGRCRIRCFNLNTWESYKSLNSCDEFPDDQSTIEKENSEPYRDYETDYCDGVIGFDFKDVAKYIRPKIKELDAIKKDNCE